MAVKKHSLSPDFWRGRRVLVTGHTGFKGSWLSFWLHRLGAQVIGIALPPSSQPNLFELLHLADQMESHFFDIRDEAELRRRVVAADAHIVFHLAAQPLVRASYREPVHTFSTNVLGTAHLLNALRFSKNTSVAVMATTDKVYRNNDWAWPYRETDVLGGHDPYSASKAASELIIDCYRNSFFKDTGLGLASARAGNVIGGGDWSEDRLIPDAVRAWQQGTALEIRRPDAVRPWQHVLDPLAGYMLLAQKLWSQPNLASAFNFGPRSDESHTVKMVVDIALQVYGHGMVDYSQRAIGPYEAGLLKLDVSLAADLLGFESRFSVKEAIERTMHWYRMQQKGIDATTLCEGDIKAYEALS